MVYSASLDQFKGCFLGGAIGDALGSPVDLMSLDQIRACCGECGVTDYAPSYDRIGAITDDTQMLLFTAEGVILSKIRPEYAQPGQVVNAVYHALLRWLYTQDSDRQGQLVRDYGTCAIVDGILTGYRELFARRDPDNTCLSALRSGQMGTLDHPINDSKGCGGLVRVAPIGLAYTDAKEAFRTGAQCAAITHGHPSGVLAAGFLAALISRLGSGVTLKTAIAESVGILKGYQGHPECLAAIDQAVDRAETSAPSSAVIESLGKGLVAEEALAISLYCAMLAADDFRAGVLLAINHCGDSAATGSITGNIIGAIHGVEIIPKDWVAYLELKDVIVELAADLYDQTTQTIRS